jgi:hypothetical protein
MEFKELRDEINEVLLDMKKVFADALDMIADLELANVALRAELAEKEGRI